MVGRWIWITLSSVAVLAGIGALLLYEADRGGSVAPADEEQVSRSEVRDEAQYYVLISILEVAPQTGKGKSWDTDGSAPDIYYEIHWQGHEVFRSSKKSDTLVARWSNVELGIKDLARGVSLDDSIKAARITVREGGELEFLVYDADVVGDDLIARWKMPTTELEEGDQVWAKPAGSLVSATCRVLPMDGVAFEALTR
jgi:hypothetical protein